MNIDTPGMRLRAVRRSRGWDALTMARALRDAAEEAVVALPDLESLVRYVRRWEADQVGISERYRLLYAAAFGTDPTNLFPDTGQDAPCGVLAGQEKSTPPTDATYVAELRAANTQIVDLDGTQGGDNLVSAAVHLFRCAHRRAMTVPCAPGVSSDLLAATAEAGEIAGWIAYDADRQELSRQLSHEALLTARLAGDKGMERFTLANLAMQDVHLQRPGEAYRIAENALEDQLTRRVRVLFEIRATRALAQLGERSRAIDTMTQVRNLYNDGPDEQDPPWAWWIDPGELTWHTAMAHADLGEWAAAAELFVRTTEQRQRLPRRVRAPFNDQTHLLRALTVLESWTDAETVLLDGVLPLLPEIASQRTSNLLRSLLPALSAPSVPSTLSDAAEELRHTLDTETLHL